MTDENLPVKTDELFDDDVYSPQQKYFVRTYLSNGKDHIAAYAYTRKVLGRPLKDPTSKAAKVTALKYLKSQSIQNLLKRADNIMLAKMQQKAESGIETAIEKYGITQEKIMSELAKIAFAQTTDVMSWDENGVVLKSSKDLGDAASAVAEVSETRNKDTGTVIKVKLYDKQQALINLGKSIGMFQESKAPVQVAVAARFVIEK